MPDERPWKLDQDSFKEPVKRWVREYEPRLPVILAVREWIRSREDDPLAGVYYVPGFTDYFHGTIPGTYVDGRVVTCAFWLDRDAKLIICDMISTKSWPV